jgi:hypothetical protein
MVTLWLRIQTVCRRSMICGLEELRKPTFLSDGIEAKIWTLDLPNTNQAFWPLDLLTSTADKQKFIPETTPPLPPDF